MNFVFTWLGIGHPVNSFNGAHIEILHLVKNTKRRRQNAFQCVQRKKNEYPDKSKMGKKGSKNQKKQQQQNKNKKKQSRRTTNKPFCPIV